MARKPKTETVPQVEEEPKIEEIPVEVISEVEEKSTSVPVEDIDKDHIKFESNKEAEAYMESLLVGTMEEITRCDEYILSKMDSYRRFQTYKDELYLFRYKVHQMRFHPNYPHVRPCDFPKRPEYVADQ